MKLTDNSQYRQVRQMIKDKVQLSVDEMKELYKKFDIVEKPYVRKHTNAFQCYDKVFSDVLYTFNTTDGIFRRRRQTKYRSFNNKIYTSDYSTHLNPRITLSNNNRVYLTKEFQNNLSKQMLYCLSNIIAKRINCNVSVNKVFTNDVQNTIKQHPMTIVSKSITSQKSSNVVSNLKDVDIHIRWNEHTQKYDITVE